MRYVYSQTILFISLILPELYTGQCSKYKNEQRQITPKKRNGRVTVFLYFYLPKQFVVVTSYGFRAMSRTRFNKKKNEQSAITQNQVKAVLKFFLTALLSMRSFYLQSFPIDIFYSNRVMSRKKV
jgi:hypothetical protein